MVLVLRFQPDGAFAKSNTRGATNYSTFTAKTTTYDGATPISGATDRSGDVSLGSDSLGSGLRSGSTQSTASGSESTEYFDQNADFVVPAHSGRVPSSRGGPRRVAKSYLRDQGPSSQ